MEANRVIRSSPDGGTPGLYHYHYHYLAAEKESCYRTMDSNIEIRVFIGNSHMKSVFAHSTNSDPRKVDTHKYLFIELKQIETVQQKLEAISKGNCIRAIFWMGSKFTYQGSLSNQFEGQYVMKYKTKFEIVKQLTKVCSLLKHYCPNIIYVEAPPRGFKVNDQVQLHKYEYLSRVFWQRHKSILASLPCKVLSWSSILIRILGLEHTARYVVDTVAFQNYFYQIFYKDVIHTKAAVYRGLFELLAYGLDAQDGELCGHPNFVMRHPVLRLP